MFFCFVPEFEEGFYRHWRPAAASGGKNEKETLCLPTVLMHLCEQGLNLALGSWNCQHLPEVKSKTWQDGGSKGLQLRAVSPGERDVRGCPRRLRTGHGKRCRALLSQQWVVSVQWSLKHLVVVELGAGAGAWLQVAGASLERCRVEQPPLSPPRPKFRHDGVPQWPETSDQCSEEFLLAVSKHLLFARVKSHWYSLCDFAVCKMNKISVIGKKGYGFFNA